MPPQVVAFASRATVRHPHHRLALGTLSLAAAWLFAHSPAAAGVNRWTSIAPAGGYFTLAAAPGAPGMALGSESGRVFKLVLGEGAVLLAIGLALGMAGLFAVRRTLTSELYGITPFEPAVLAAATLMLSLVALAGCVVPA